MKDRRDITAQPPRGKREPPTVQFDLGRPPGRQALDRVLPKGEFDTRNMLHKLLRQTGKRKRGGDGFHKETDGLAAAILNILRDPPAREEFLQLARISPEKFRSEEGLARSLTVGLMIVTLAHMIDAIALKRLALFERERDMAQMLRGLGAPFNDDADRSAWKAKLHLLTADLVNVGARQLGHALERDFGVRAPRLVAEVINRACGLEPKMTEGQARYLCGWKKLPAMEGQTKAPVR